MKHGAKFGVTTEAEYEQMADAFMFDAMDADTRECVRPSLTDRLRFKAVNRHFGVACIQPAFVRTFYPVPPKRIAKRGGPEPFFAYECGRTNL